MSYTPHQPDDLDQLYERLPYEELPANFAQRVMTRVQLSQRVQYFRLVASGLVILCLGLLGYMLGRSLEFTGAVDFVETFALNLDLVFDAAEDILPALLDFIPWLELSIVALGIMGLWLASNALPHLWLTRGKKVN